MKYRLLPAADGQFAVFRNSRQVSQTFRTIFRLYGTLLYVETEQDTYGIYDLETLSFSPVQKETFFRVLETKNVKHS